MSTKTVSSHRARALEIHRSSTIVLGHDHMECGDDYPKMKAGGVTAKIYSPIVDADIQPTPMQNMYEDAGWCKRALFAISSMYEEMDRTKGKVFLAKSASDVRQAKKEGRIAILLAFEGAKPLEGRLELLKIYHRLGLRALQLSWSFRNQVCDGQDEADSPGRLTGFGKEVVRELDRLGILCDVSHMKEHGFRDVIEITKNPVLVSHSGARVVCNFRQNLTDEQLKLLAENGGVLCLHFFPPIVKGAGATVSDMLDHVDHVASLVGTKHIGLGPDFFPRKDPWLSFINSQGFSGPISFIIDDSSKMLEVTTGLVERGYSDHEIQGVLGGNILRILEKVT